MTQLAGPSITTCPVRTSCPSIPCCAATDTLNTALLGVLSVPSHAATSLRPMHTVASVPCSKGCKCQACLQDAGGHVRSGQAITACQQAAAASTGVLLARLVSFKQAAVCCPEPACVAAVAMPDGACEKAAATPRRIQSVSKLDKTSCTSCRRHGPSGAGVCHVCEPSSRGCHGGCVHCRGSPGLAAGHGVLA